MLLKWMPVILCVVCAPQVQADTTVVERRSEVRTQPVPPSASGGLTVLLGRVNQLQTEVQELRGQAELLMFEIQRIRQNQKDRYLDLDTRLNRLETGGVGAVPVPTPIVADGAETLAPDVSQVDVAKEQQAYDAAFALLRNRAYADAEQAFAQFLQDFIGGDYADNAQYWLAEAQYVQNNVDAALAAFQQVIDGYPSSPKIPDAYLKIGYILSAKGDIAKAKQILSKLLKSYPGSTTARLAKRKLLALKRQR